MLTVAGGVFLGLVAWSALAAGVIWLLVRRFG